MSVKKMIELYLAYGLCEDTWDMLYKMVCHNLISRNNWSKFYETCRGWYFDGETNTILDDKTGKLVAYYDSEGFLRRAN